jgi:dolichol-phosphate mannosyltransferase
VPVREALVNRSVELHLSIVIPVRNEEENVLSLAAEIAAAFGAPRFRWEVVWVDDGSTDGSAARLAQLPEPHRLIRLHRNQGQSAALVAGFLAARGTWIGTLDGDGQNDPRDILRQLEYALRYGFDMVNGIRVDRHDTLFRRVASRIANAARNWIIGDQVADVGCSTRVLRREAALQVPYFHGMHRFLPTLVAMRGFTVTEIPVSHRARHAGRSKYGIHDRLWTGIGDLLGVRWLVSRQRVWKAVELLAGSPAVWPAPSASRQDVSRQEASPQAVGRGRES